MKSLISVTPHEFKRHFGEVMEIATDICMTVNQEIAITIPEKKNGHTYVEAAKVTPVEGGIKYKYNYETLKKFGISTDYQTNKIENIITDAFEKSGIAECARNNKEVAKKLQDTMLIATEELINQLGL